MKEGRDEMFAEGACMEDRFPGETVTADAVEDVAKDTDGDAVEDVAKDTDGDAVEDADEDMAGDISVCPHCRTTDRTEEQKKKLLNRLSRIEGQIRGIRGMIERDAYCNDILIQSAAASAAIHSFNKELLSAHIHSCVVRDIRDGDDEVVDELVATIYKLMK